MHPGNNDVEKFIVILQQAGVHRRHDPDRKLRLRLPHMFAQAQDETGLAGAAGATNEYRVVAADLIQFIGGSAGISALFCGRPVAQQSELGLMLLEQSDNACFCIGLKKFLTIETIRLFGLKQVQFDRCHERLARTLTGGIVIAKPHSIGSGRLSATALSGRL
ncbi:MAG: hypothetical protein JNM98_21560 [Rhodocyclaceae bacterium]|nr:hypothetical protein [Rhodocyclaceae bacterium]